MVERGGGEKEVGGEERILKENLSVNLVFVLCGLEKKCIDNIKLLMQAPPTDPLYDASHPDESTNIFKKMAKGGVWREGGLRLDKVK